jgi:hypothetical protein
MKKRLCVLACFGVMTGCVVSRDKQVRLDKTFNIESNVPPIPAGAPADAVPPPGLFPQGDGLSAETKAEVLRQVEALNQTLPEAERFPSYVDTGAASRVEVGDKLSEFRYDYGADYRISKLKKITLEVSGSEVSTTSEGNPAAGPLELFGFGLTFDASKGVPERTFVVPCGARPVPDLEAWDGDRIQVRFNQCMTALSDLASSGDLNTAILDVFNEKTKGFSFFVIGGKVGSFALKFTLYMKFEITALLAIITAPGTPPP